jgi:hypothetical protein
VAYTLHFVSKKRAGACLSSEDRRTSVLGCSIVLGRNIDLTFFRIALPPLCRLIAIATWMSRTPGAARSAPLTFILSTITALSSMRAAH